MKKSILIGGLVAGPLAYGLLTWYATTPEDPQKAIGYVTIPIFCGFVWIVVALLAEGLFRVFSQRKKEGIALLLPATAGLIAILSLLWPLQRELRQVRRLETTMESDLLRREAVDALEQKRPRALIAIADNRHTPGDTLAEMASCDDPAVLGRIAGNPNTPQSVLKSLSGHRSYPVKMALLQNRSTGEEIVRKLSNSRDPRIRKAAHARMAGERLPAE
ncbi:MAG TPA: hypothetical protein VNQ90_07940 [Chthoniobacteraceae bacterium]|nr:hypothetical protein [Chthoniobacteraceae bacterium]